MMKKKTMSEQRALDIEVFVPWRLMGGYTKSSSSAPCRNHILAHNNSQRLSIQALRHACLCQPKLFKAHL